MNNRFTISPTMVRFQLRSPDLLPVTVEEKAVEGYLIQFLIFHDPHCVRRKLMICEMWSSIPDFKKYILILKAYKKTVRRLTAALVIYICMLTPHQRGGQSLPLLPPVSVTHRIHGIQNTL